MLEKCLVNFMPPHMKEKIQFPKLNIIRFYGHINAKREMSNISSLKEIIRN